MVWGGVSPGDFGELLARLGILRGAAVYVQSSMDRLRALGFAAAAVLDALDEAVGGAGLLVMPGYPFATRYEQYVADPAPFDVRRTPVATGLLPALLFRRAGTVRSANPFYPVLAAGADAAALVADHDSSDNPLDARSPYRRMIDRDAVLLGAGVSLNYNSFIHTIDLAYADELPFRYFTKQPYRKDLVDEAGRRRTIAARLPVAEVIRAIRPSEAYRHLALEDGDFRFIDIDGTYFFRVRLKQFEQAALVHARERLRAGRLPCWLEGLFADDVR
jgi:aminoglycoside N3'-acetyltransferase